MKEHSKKYNSSATRERKGTPTNTVEGGAGVYGVPSRAFSGASSCLPPQHPSGMAFGRFQP